MSEILTRSEFEEMRDHGWRQYPANEAGVVSNVNLYALHRDKIAPTIEALDEALSWEVSDPLGMVPGQHERRERLRAKGWIQPIKLGEE